MACEIRLDSGTIWAVLLGLVLFSIGYNSFVAYLERRGYTEGYTSLLVVAGVFITLCGLAILSIQAALLALMAFAASGIPMVIGSIVRYIQKRDQMKRAMIEETK